MHGCLPPAGNHRPRGVRAETRSRRRLDGSSTLRRTVEERAGGREGGKGRGGRARMDEATVHLPRTAEREEKRWLTPDGKQRQQF